MNSNRLLHPLRSARTARSWLATHLHMWRFGSYGRRRFRGDARYDLQHVSRGFASRLAGEEAIDRPLLDRICAAYNKARSHPQAGAYQPSDSYQHLLHTRLAPSVRALLGHDTAALGAMYRNFYRDPCSAGLLAAPGGMARAYFGEPVRDIYRHFYLSHVLCRLDYWQQITAGRFSLQHLAGPAAGNPFGIEMDETLIGVGSEYSHYCAQRAAALIDRLATPRPTVAETGGGFGATAYYLLRDHQPLTLFNFDFPERIALSSWYLMKAFPHLAFRLCGEESGGPPADVVLLPFSSLEDQTPGSLDVSFSSAGFAGLSPPAARHAAQRLAALTRQSMLFIGKQASSAWFAETIRSQDPSFLLTDSRTSAWHSHKITGAGVGGAAALASSALFEETFVRQSVADDTRRPSAREQSHARQR